MRSEKDGIGLLAKLETIIYSGYIKDFEKMCAMKEWHFDKIKQIEKSGFSISELITAVNLICNG